MASWILSQQWLISLLVLCLLVNEYKLSAKLGPKLSYRYWLLVPVAILINNLPQQLLLEANNQISVYIVSLKQQDSGWLQLEYWQLIWGIGAIAILLSTIKSSVMFAKRSKFSAIDASNLPVVIPSSLTVYQSDQVAGAMLIGLLKPKLILPSDYQTAYSKTQLTLILEHELCHYQRFDNLMNVLAIIILSLCWFNPLVWLGYRSFRRSQEIACDSHVLQNKNTQQRIEYAKALINCAEQANTKLCIHSNYSQRNIMFKRINMLKSQSLVNRPSQYLATLVAGVLLSSVAFAKPIPEMDNVAQNDVKPITRVNPRYPIQAAKDGVQGSVVLQFDITKTGEVENIVVLKSQPEGVFSKEARRALRLWRYTPESAGKGNTVQLDFTIDIADLADIKKKKAYKKGIERIKVKS
ncbi:MAG: TonB family protein [Psychrobium sp.]|nr:TonB family protein [Psychrobium sp.]